MPSLSHQKNGSDSERKTQLVIPRPGQLQINDEVFDHWKLSYWPYYNNSGQVSMKGPLCIACKNPMLGITSETKEFTCTGCGKQVSSDKPYSQLIEEAHQALEGYLLRGKPVISLNTPVSSVWTSDQDEFHKVIVKLSQKGGKKVAKILILDRRAGGEKVDLFANIDNQELTRDPSDLPPGSLLTEVTATFRDTQQTTSFSPPEEKTE